MHLDEAEVQRLVHGEMAAPAERAARDHLAQCTQCDEEVARAAREEERVADLLRLIDHAPPAIDVRAIVARAPAPRMERGRWAAGLLLAMGLAGVAYAAPGLPLRGWIAAALEAIGGRPGPSLVPGTAPVPGAAGVAVEPGNDLLIEFTSARNGSTARLELTDGVEVEVRTRIGAATFTSNVGQLVIENQKDSAAFEIEIPRSASRVEIRVAGKRVFLKEASRLTTTAAPDERGRYHLSLAETRP